jgi:hypothetical protein
MESFSSYVTLYWKEFTEAENTGPKGDGYSGKKQPWDLDKDKKAKALKRGRHSLEADEAVSPAQRRARKQAYLLKTMKKYGDAAKMGIPADQVNQRRNTPTRKKR